eukprot:Skav216021  [mRNA]  locus=scaffold417:71814:76708:+ [translate_table: standard]
MLRKNARRLRYRWSTQIQQMTGRRSQSTLLLLFGNVPSSRSFLFKPHTVVSWLLRWIDVNASPCVTDMAFEEPQKPGVVKLQLEFDEFGEVSEDSGARGIFEPVPELAELGSGVDEQVDDVTAEVRLPETERLNTHQLEAVRGGTPEPWPSLAGRWPRAVGKSLEDVNSSRAGNLRRRELVEHSEEAQLWKPSAQDPGLCSAVEVETFLGTDRKAQLAGALDVASSAAETLVFSTGDLFGALGAGFMSGANEIAGVGELLKGDFAGAMQKRQEVWKADAGQEASTEDGRLALKQKADEAMKRAKKQVTCAAALAAIAEFWAER